MLIYPLQQLHIPTLKFPGESNAAGAVRSRPESCIVPKEQHSQVPVKAGGNRKMDVALENLVNGYRRCKAKNAESLR